MSEKTAPYTVSMVDAASLSGSERSAAELRFRMALQAGGGGRDLVVPALQACMLARSLTRQLSPGHWPMLVMMPSAK